MNKLSRFLTHGYTNRYSKILTQLLPDSIVLLTIKKSNPNNSSSNTLPSLHIIPDYNHSNIAIDAIKKTVTQSDFNHSISLCVFGSVASNETTNYSDLDSVLIYDENYFKNNSRILKLRNLIASINQLSHLQDSLQHHGVIVTSRSELASSSQAVLTDLIKESKLIYGNCQVEISNQMTNDFSANYKKLIRSILAKIEKENNWTNQYFFKNMISELLLLPSVLIQNKENKFIAKKESFELIGNYASPSFKISINQIEKIRTNWTQPQFTLVELSKTKINALKKNQKTPLFLLDSFKQIAFDLKTILNQLNND